MAMRSKSLSGKWLWAALAAIVLLAGGAGGYLFWRSRSNPVSAVPASPYQTSRVNRGNLVRSASGSGTLVAGSQTELSFPVAGVVDQVTVSVGDKVTAGQVLASLADLDQLKLAVETQKIALNTAQKSLDELSKNADLNLAQAALTLADAQTALSEAQNNLLSKGQERCNDTLTSKYYYQYLDAQKNLDIWQGELKGESKYGRDFILEHVNSYKKQRDYAYANWSYCNAYTDQEIAESQSALQLAKANMGAAEINLAKLKENNGIDPLAVALAQAKVSSAQTDLALAESNLSGAVIHAPSDGTVLSIAGSAGDQVGTDPFIVLADLEHPAIQLTVDETDLQNIAVGCTVSVTFDSIPGRTFQGDVSEVTPQLVSAGNTSAIQALVPLAPAALGKPESLPIGLNASAEVTCGEANNVLLIPVEALHKLGDGTTAVYVLGANGTPEQRLVETGMQDYTQVEIRSGLQAGELVITQGPGIPG